MFMTYWVYILQSESTGRYYIGHTNDLEDRLTRHTEGRTAANKGRGPWRLVHREEYPTRQAAAARERAIKNRKSRRYIETLCSRSAVG
jgi:putative endonuclease